jgi:transcriptional regulator with XRE-family HTH domain
MLSDVVGERITTWRKRRGLNREALAERCAALGLHLTAESFTNIESGRRKDGVRRRTITIDELMVIARALNVPPILLIVPYPDKDNVELVPGEILATPEAVHWISGESSIGQTTGDAWVDWVDTASPVLFLRAYRKEFDSYMDLSSQLVHAEQRAEHLNARARNAESNNNENAQSVRLTANVQTAKVKALRTEFTGAEQRIADLRATMIDEGFPPPPLPSGFEHLAELEGVVTKWGWAAYRLGDRNHADRVQLSYGVHRARKDDDSARRRD